MPNASVTARQRIAVKASANFAYIPLKYSQLPAKSLYYQRKTELLPKPKPNCIVRKTHLTDMFLCQIIAQQNTYTP